jgi:hypothetical protein
MTPAVRRARAAQSCIDRFSGRPFLIGRRDCAKLAGHQLHALGIKVPFLKGVRWTSETTAVKALKKLGFDDLDAAVDAVGLPRIGWASALVGDLISLPSDHKIGALGVYLGNGAVLCFRDGSDLCLPVRLQQANHAWRTL